MAYNAKPWLRLVGLASVSGMSDAEVEQRGFQIMLDAMRAAYTARHGTPTTVTPDPIRGPASSEQG